MADRFKVKIGGQSHEVYMSFGMLNEVSTLVGDIQNVAFIQTDNELRTQVLNALLAERSNTGTIETPVNFMTLELPVDEAMKLLSWAGDHVFDFFLKSLEGAQTLGEKHGPRMQSLLSSLTGSEDSPGPTPSASSSSADQATST